MIKLLNLFCNFVLTFLIKHALSAAIIYHVFLCIWIKDFIAGISGNKDFFVGIFSDIRAYLIIINVVFLDFFLPLRFP